MTVDHRRSSTDCVEKQNCPSEDELRGVLQGMLPTTRRDLVLQCCESCSQCELRLQQLEISLHRQQLFPSADYSNPFAYEPACENVLVQLQVMLRDVGETSDTQVGVEGFDTVIPTEEPVDPNTDASVVGKRFGNYQVQLELASGGMGRVYRALDLRLNRVVALKLMQRGHSANKEDLQRFRTEAMTAAKLDHPDIVQIYEVGKAEGAPYLAMRYIEGENLGSYQLRQALSPRRIAEIVLRITKAIAYAHSQGVIHRDLKPSNVIVDTEGNPKVTDFGLAKSVDTGCELTSTGQVLGTPSYMPPEQARGQLELIGPLSDVYGLGGILYYLLTGLPPFRAESMIATIQQVLDSPLRAPRSINPTADRDLETLCLKCLEKEPHNRIPSADDLAIQLTRYLNGQPISYRPISWATRTIRWCRRKPLAATVLMSMPAIVMLIGLAITLGLRSARDQQFIQANREFQQHLSTLSINSDDLKQVDVLVQRLQELSPKSGEEAEVKLRSHLQDLISNELNHPRLTDRDLVDLQRKVSLLKDRFPDHAHDLDSELQRRKREWRLTAELESPFLNAEEVFNSADIAVASTAIHTTNQALLELHEPTKTWGTPVLQTKQQCNEDFEINLDFGSQWSEQNMIGVVIGDPQKPNFEFQLRSSALTHGTQPLAIQDAESHLEHVVAEIKQQGFSLRQQRIEFAAIKSKSMHFRARREGENLLLQINSLPELTFRNTFPGYSNQSQLCLYATTALRIEKLALRTKIRNPLAPTLVGDLAYEARKFEEAERHYLRLSEQGTTKEICQEAKFKLSKVLQQQGRALESSSLLESLAMDEGQYWPALSALELWRSLLNDGRKEEARSIANYYDSRFQNLPYEFYPCHFWHQIISNYTTKPKNLTSVLQKTVEQPELLDVVARIDRRFTANQLGTPDLQHGIANMFRLQDDYEPALELYLGCRNAAMSAHLWLDNRHQTLRLLRCLGKFEEALSYYDSEHQKADTASQKETLAFQKIYLLCDLDRWEEAHALVDQLIQAHVPTELNRHGTVNLYAIKASLARQRGDTEAELAARKVGWEVGRQLLQTEPLAASATLNSLVQGCILGDFVDEDFNKLLNNKEMRSNMMLSMVTKAFPKSLRQDLIDAWQSPQGRVLADDLALDRLTMRQRIRLPAALIGSFVISNNIMDGPTDDQYMSIIDRLANEVIDGFLVQDLGASQAVQLGLAWKGTTNTFGWNGLRQSLGDSQRAAIATILAHRFIKLKMPASVIDELWNEAIQNPDEVVRAASEANKQAFNKNVGFLRIVNDGPVQLTVELKPKSGDEPRSFDVPSNPTGTLIELVAQEYEINRVNDGKFEQSYGTIRLLPAAHRLLRIGTKQ